MIRSVVAASAALVLLSAPAAAGGFTVKSPGVEAGEVEVETKGALKFDGDDAKDDGQAYELELAAGMTDWLKLALAGEWERETGPGEQVGFEAFVIEATIQLADADESWASVGLLLEAGLNPEDGTNDEVEAALLVSKPFWGADHTLNLALARDIGPGASDDTGFAFAWRTLFELDHGVEAGFEYYGEPGALGEWPGFDDQDHYAGPVLHAHWHALGGEVEAELGYLFGLTETASDGALKWKLAWVKEF